MGYVTDFSINMVVLIIVTQPIVCLTPPSLQGAKKSKFPSQNPKIIFFKSPFCERPVASQYPSPDWFCEPWHGSSGKVGSGR